MTATTASMITVVVHFVTSTKIMIATIVGSWGARVAPVSRDSILLVL